MENKLIEIAKECKKEGIDPMVACAIINRTEIGKEKPKEQTNWREEPATEKQKKKLDSLGLMYDKSITKGKASDLIDKN